MWSLNRPKDYEQGAMIQTRKNKAIPKKAIAACAVPQPLIQVSCDSALGIMLCFTSRHSSCIICPGRRKRSLLTGYPSVLE